MFNSIKTEEQLSLLTIISIFNYKNLYNNVLCFITRKEYDDLIVPSEKEKIEIQSWIDSLSTEPLSQIIILQNNIDSEDYGIHVKLMQNTHLYKLNYYRRLQHIITYYNNFYKKNKRNVYMTLKKYISLRIHNRSKFPSQ